MVRLAANLTMMFASLPLSERLARAAEAGFRGVEVLFPYDEMAAAEMARALDRHGLSLVLLNASPGDWTAGERGLAALPGREAEFRAGLDRAVAYARATFCPRLHVMAGLVPPGVAPAPFWRCYAENLARAAEAAPDLQILIEPINTRIDMPGYLLDSTAAALEVIDRIGAPNLALQYDIYHMHIMEDGARPEPIRKLLPRIGHMQLADHPGRHEPGTGEIDFATLLPALDAMGYAGWIGCEYREQAGLGWAADWLA